MRIVFRFSRTIAQDAIISETTKGAPSDFAKARNGKSVTPDNGAKITGAGKTTARAPDPTTTGRTKGENPLLMIWANYSSGGVKSKARGLRPAVAATPGLAY
jgi:hypothetical protein